LNSTAALEMFVPDSSVKKARMLMLIHFEAFTFFLQAFVSSMLFRSFHSWLK